MKPSERFEQIQAVTDMIDSINDRFGAYSSYDGDGLVHVEDLTGKEALAWSNKRFNRQQCYALMYNKLILAYYISEIQAGTMLTASFLETIAECRLEIWDDFLFDEEGRKIGSVLKTIVAELLKECSFQCKEYYIDIEEALDCGDDDLIIRGGTLCRKGREQFIETLSEDYPVLHEVIEDDPCIEGIVLSIDGFLAYATDGDDLELGLQVLESSFMYEVDTAEKKENTVLGRKILEKGAKIIQKISLKTREIVNGAEWTFWNDKDKTLVNCSIMCADVMGDEFERGIDFYPRIYNFSLCAVKDLLELSDLIQQYQREHSKKARKIEA